MQQFSSVPSDNSQPASRAGTAVPPGAYAIVSPEAMLEEERALIARIKLTAGVDERTYERYYVPLLRDYAAFVDSLPASRARHHFVPGGLWRHSLEVALFALQGSDNKIFTASEPVERRHLVEPRWRLAAFVAGLLGDAGITMSSMRVTTAKGEAWEPLLAPLLRWASDRGERYYYVQWLPQAGQDDGASHRVFSGVIATRLVPTDILTYLAEGSIGILHELMLCLSGQVRSQGRETLLQIVEQAKRASVEREIRSRAGIVPTGTVGFPVEIYLLDAIRHLIRRRWRLNEEGSPLWGSRKDGLFLVWEQAAPQIVEYLDHTGVQAMPRDSKTLAELLRLHQITRPPHGNEHYGLFCRIRVPGRGELTAVALANPEAVFDETPTLQEIDLLNPEDRQPGPRGDTPTGESVPPTTRAPQQKAAIAPPQPAAKEASGAQAQLELAYGSAQQYERTPSPPVPGTHELRAQSEETNAKSGEENTSVLRAPAPGNKPTIPSGRTEQPASLGPAEALAHLRSHGKAGELLAAMAEEVQRGQRQVGVDLFLVEEGMAVSFPEALKGLGFEAIKVIQIFNSTGWVVQGAGASKGLVREVNVGRALPVRAVVLAPAVAKYVAVAANLSMPAGWGNLPKGQRDA